MTHTRERGTPSLKFMLSSGLRSLPSASRSGAPTGTRRDGDSSGSQVQPRLARPLRLADTPLPLQEHQVSRHHQPPLQPQLVAVNVPRVRPAPRSRVRRAYLRVVVQVEHELPDVDPCPASTLRPGPWPPLRRPPPRTQSPAWDRPPHPPRIDPSCLGRTFPPRTDLAPRFDP